MSIRSWRLAIVLAAVSCRETTAPAGSNEKGARLSPASPTQLTGTVGVPVADLPSVTVRDASGHAVAGVVVIFSVRSGHGTIETPVAVSSSEGIARAARWTLGSVPGKNVIVATSASSDTVVFTADAVAGSPSQLQKVGGDGQFGLPGQTLAVRPRVRVSDVFDNPLSGVTVTFAVEAGGGSVSGAAAVTDSAGFAESGNWVLGQTGPQRMVARAGELVSAPFTARIVLPPVTCPPSAVLPIQTTILSELSTLSCKGTDGRSVDGYTIVVTQPSAYVFTLSSAEFDTYLELRSAGLIEVARNDDRSATTTNSEIKALLPPGTYTLFASASKLGASGSYSVSYHPAGTTADMCEEVFIVRGITAGGVVYDSDCNISPDQFSDRFLIYLDAGSRVEIQVKDFSYSGPNVQMVSPDGSHDLAGPGANYLTTLNYVAPIDGYYTVLVGLTNESGVVYTIAIR
jgi:hypothetical protein